MTGGEKTATGGEATASSQTQIIVRASTLARSTMNTDSNIPATLMALTSMGNNDQARLFASRL